MRVSILILLLLVTMGGLAIGQPLLDYQTETPWIPETPGVTSGAVGGFINPAVWSTSLAKRAELAFWWNDRSLRNGALDNFGMASSGWLGWGLNSQVFEIGDKTYRVTDWQSGMSFGKRSSRFGVAYRFPTGDHEMIGREKAIILGFLSRPYRAVSGGYSYTKSLETNTFQNVLDLGLRPLGDDRLTFYGDYTVVDTDRWNEGRWGAGVTLQPVHGLHAGLTFRESPNDGDIRWTANVGVTLSDLGMSWLPQWSADGDLAASTFLARINPPQRSLVNELPTLVGGPTRLMAPLNLEHRYLTYQSYRMFDNRRVAWLALARYLDAVEADPRLSGIVINLRDFRGRPSLVWEFRQRLQDLQAAGKEVVIQITRVNILGYYLASVADRLIIDPQGDLGLEGFATGRTYFQDMLEKMGLGFQEFRYFKYKSALEVGSRMDMSEGQREQAERLIDVLYDEVRAQVCDSRDLTPGEFDALVDDMVAVSPERAMELGLVDMVGRNHDIKTWMSDEQHAVFAAPHHRLWPGAYPETEWGELPEIAVVYAVGGCAMDSGIRGRATGRHLERLAEDPNVKAVVLRADSPGGDPLPSDLVAAGLTRCIEAGKPVIVSQGDVAASGGYWISMNGEEIVTTPLTITGSIGVIGAWVYDDGAGDKLGLNYDGVKRGEHADLSRSLRLPGLNISLPHRPLDEKELRLVREYILQAYDGFVAKVAEGRGLSEDEVRDVAQGRVWMGGDAIDRRLCDRFGGLSDAIATARERAGLGDDRKVRIAEYPKRPFINWGALLGGGPGRGLPFRLLSPLVGGGVEVSPWNDDAVAAAEVELPVPFDYGRFYLETVGAEMGEPRMVLPPEMLPAGWGEPE